MVLNKNGWGLSTMIILSAVLILFLFVSIYLITSFDSNFYHEVSDDFYLDLEEKLENQASIYINDYYEEMLSNEYVTVTQDILRRYDLDVVLIDPYGRTCNGYVRINKSRGVINNKAYISCSKYETEGYQDWRE